MLPRRRIFRPAHSPRRFRGVLAVLGLASLATLVVGLGLPGNLFGSAPREQSWVATAAQVTVLDGETLRLGDRILRLKGLDAPDRGEACRGDCAGEAAAALSRLVRGRDLTCAITGRDAFGRGLGRCAAGSVDVNLTLVATGYAIAAPGTRGALVAAEQEARQANRGLWASGTPEAWQTRR